MNRSVHFFAKKINTNRKIRHCKSVKQQTFARNFLANHQRTSFNSSDMDYAKEYHNDEWSAHGEALEGKKRKKKKKLEIKNDSSCEERITKGDVEATNLCASYLAEDNTTHKKKKKKMAKRNLLDDCTPVINDTLNADDSVEAPEMLQFPYSDEVVYNKTLKKHRKKLNTGVYLKNAYVNTDNCLSGELNSSTLKSPKIKTFIHKQKELKGKPRTAHIETNEKISSLQSNQFKFGALLKRVKRENHKRHNREEKPSSEDDATSVNMQPSFDAYGEHRRYHEKKRSKKSTTHIDNESNSHFDDFVSGLTSVSPFVTPVKREDSFQFSKASVVDCRPLIDGVSNRHKHKEIGKCKPHKQKRDKSLSGFPAENILNLKPGAPESPKPNKFSLLNDTTCSGPIVLQSPLDRDEAAEADEQLEKKPQTVAAPDLDIKITWKLSLLHNRSITVVSDEEKASFKKLGIKYKQGHWTKEEEATLQKNWSAFQKEYHVLDPFSILGLGKSYTNLIRKFIQYLAKGLDDRSLMTVYQKCRQRLGTKWITGRLNTEEEKTLNHLVSIHGPQWQLIGQKMKRNPVSLQVIYKRSYDKAVRSGKWSAEEDDKLMEAVQSVVGDDNCVFGNKKVLYNLPWEKISTLVNTRNNKQCRDRWINYLYNYLNPNANQVENISTVEFLKRLHSTDAKYSFDVNWRKLSEKLRFATPAQLQMRWYRLKSKHANEVKSYTFRDSVEYFLAVYSSEKSDLHIE